jgi:outer membrane murein-binding lipoprotein Lpp
MLLFRSMSSRKELILAALSVVALSGVLAWSWMDRRTQEQKIRSLESEIATLEASLQEKEHELKDARPDSRAAQNTESPANGGARKERVEQAAAGNVGGSYQVLKELEADSATDPRTDEQKLQALLADNPTDEEAAIACRFIFNKAADTRGLPDYALQSIYAGQTNPDLKRVIAQVLSQRGNDALLNQQIVEAQATLRSTNPKDHLDALDRLARIHSVRAVDAIAPSLQDPDRTVRLAALFALRDSGNQRHIDLAEPLTRDADPSVSTLAANVVSALKNLSSSARTSYSRADIEAELPPIANP